MKPATHTHPGPDDGDLFLALPDGTFVCPECMPEEVADDAELWRCFSRGWTGAPICHVCRVATPVFVDESK